MQHLLKYYVSGHTAKGYVNFLSSNLVNIEKTIILQHPSKKIKTMILERLIERYKKNEQIEMICSSQSYEYIEGIIIREKSFAILTDQVVQEKQFTVKNIDLENYLSIRVDQKKMQEAESKMMDLYESAYNSF